MTTIINDLVAEHMVAVSDMIDDVLLQATVVGCGASVIREGLTTSAFIDENVAELQLCEFPSMDAYYLWLDLGCPK